MENIEKLKNIIFNNQALLILIIIAIAITPHLSETSDQILFITFIA